MNKHLASFPYYTFANLDRFGEIRHFVTSCCQGELTNVNLRSPLGAQNRQRLAQSVGFVIDRLVTGEQTHSLNIAVVTEKEAGLGNLDIDSRIPCTDALITNVKGICIMVLTADCVPVLLYDCKTHSVAAIHSGWKGTLNRISQKTVFYMQSLYGTRPEDLRAVIGPGICRHCFQVGDEVVGYFKDNGIDIHPIYSWDGPKAENMKGGHHLDLIEENRLLLIESGVPAANIHVAGVCTYEDGRFFSARREGAACGRIINAIKLL